MGKTKEGAAENSPACKPKNGLLKVRKQIFSLSCAVQVLTMDVHCAYIPIHAILLLNKVK